MNDEETIRGLLVKVNEKPVVIDIPVENQLQELQKLVGGYIEVVGLEKKGENDEQYEVDIVCNEEGKICGLPLNRAYTYSDITKSDCNDIVDIIAGDFLVLGGDMDTGQFISLPQQELLVWRERFETPIDMIFNDIYSDMYMPNASFVPFETEIDEER